MHVSYKKDISNTRHITITSDKMVAPEIPKVQSERQNQVIWDRCLTNLVVKTLYGALGGGTVGMVVFRGTLLIPLVR